MMRRSESAPLSKPHLAAHVLDFLHDRISGVHALSRSRPHRAGLHVVLRLGPLAALHQLHFDPREWSGWCRFRLCVSHAQRSRQLSCAHPLGFYQFFCVLS
jgi:hypothetical protein